MTAHDDEQLAAQAIEAGAYEEAVRLLQPLADGNSEYALLSLGWIAETGAIGSVDRDKARSYYERAADGGSASAYLYLGLLLLRSGEDTRARAAFARGADLNSDECKSELARLNDDDTERLAAQAIENGFYDEAIRLLQPLAERNRENALLSLGWIYETEATDVADKETALSYYEQAITYGSAAACSELGRLLLSEGEEERARSVFKVGAELGDIPCMARLGKMMVAGRGGPVDIGAGSTWLQNAASQGHILAQRTLIDVENRKSRSLFDKLLTKSKILALVGKGAREMLKDPKSDNMR